MEVIDPYLCQKIAHSGACSLDSQKPFTEAPARPTASNDNKSER